MIVPADFPKICALPLSLSCLLYTSSIIVPVYNSQRTIERCLTSILEQTYRNLEIIVVDDGSTDNSVQIINQYKVDGRIHLISKKNGGVSSARNTGLSIAQGDFIQFVDSDDYLSSNMTERLVTLITTNNCDLVICGYKYINGNRELYLPKQLYDGTDVIKNAFLRLWKTTYINIPWNKLYRRALCKGISFPPVSYTHLDVYKRQFQYSSIYECSFAIRKKVRCSSSDRCC